MHKNLKYWTIAGMIWVGTAGTLLHFLYEWTGRNSLAGLIGPVNESTWEHMKLLFFPMLLFILIEYKYLKGPYPALLAARTAGLVAGLILIPAVFYTYTAILGKNYLILDILTFIISVIAAFLTGSFLAGYNRLKRYNTYAAAVLLLLTVCFFVFTYAPPPFELFRDPSAPDSGSKLTSSKNYAILLTNMTGRM